MEGKGYRTLVWQSNGPDTMGAFLGGCIVSDAYLLILFLVQI